MDLTLNNTGTAAQAWVASATGVVALLGLLFIILFFTVGQPWGTLNDICIGVAGLLSAVLAWLLLAGQTGPATALSRLALGVAVVGALVVALGSVLVIFQVTSFVLAGFYNELGNALIGLWLGRVLLST